MKCNYCGENINGDATIKGDVVLHKRCIDYYDRKQKGLTFECPVCKTKGEVPSGQKTEKRVKVPAGQPGDCAWNGCRGCSHCGTTLIKIDVMKECDFCDGVGWLKREPVPVTGIIGWKK